MDTVPPVLSLHRISKRFFGTAALQDVSVDFRPGAVHAVVGENGAGKSTLMKIIAGEYPPDSGEVRLDGQRIRLTHPQQAQARGISLIHQEFTLLPERSVAENVFLGREPRRRLGVDRAAMAAGTAELLGQLGLATIRPDTLVRRLSVAHQQGVEIAKALSHRPRILVMDEPTAALSPTEVAALFARIRDLVRRGLTVLYISHRLGEVFELAERVTVLKDGQLVDTVDVTRTSPAELVTRMVGRETRLFAPVRTRPAGPVRLTVRALSGPRLRDINLDLRAGEIVGVAGLDGSGRAELARTVAGAERPDRGVIEVDGRRLRPGSPRAAIRAGVGFLSADRKAEGLVLPLSAADNGLLAVRALRGSRLDRLALPALAKRVGLPKTALGKESRLLSGGNQQKVVLAKWLATMAGVYLFEEPTRGIDIGAKAAIHQLMRELADNGAAVLMISSELTEVIGVSDRILVMRRGHLAGELPAGAGEEDIMRLATS